MGASAAAPQSSETDALGAKVDALLSAIAEAPDPMRLLIDAIALRHELHVAGRFEDERRMLRGVIARDEPVALTARHRYYLALLAIDDERLEDARRHLLGVEGRIGESVPLPPSGYWRDHFLGERHNLEMGRAELYRAAGLLTQASVYRARAQDAFYAYALNRASEGREVPAARLAVTRLFDLDFELARMRYADALRLADRSLASAEFSSANEFQIVRRRAAALAQLALDDPAYVETAREALEAIAQLPDTSDVASAEDRFDACFRLVRLHALAGQREPAQRWSREALRLSTLDDSTPRMRSRELLVSMELDAWLADPAASFEPALDASWDTAMQERLAWWRERTPKPGGTGTLHFDRVDYVLDVGIRSALRRPSDGEPAALERLCGALGTNDFFRRLGAPTRTLDEQLACLRTDEVALFLFSAAAGGYGFLATEDGEVDVFRTSTSKALRAAAGRFRRVVTTPPTADAEARRRELRDAQEELVRSLGLDLPRLFAAESVVVVASELAYDPALEALALKGSTLGCQTILSHVPCLDLLVSLRETVRDAEIAGTRVVSDVPYAEWQDPRERDLPRVDVGDPRIAAWADSIGGEAALQTGRNGTVESLMGAAAAQEEALIVFAHGDRVESLDRSSALVLGAEAPAPADSPWAEDAAAGRLTADAIESMPGWDVVFLAACGAGSGPAALGGGGGNHLGGAFLSTGSRAVLLSRDALPAASTAAMLDRWTGAVGDGATVGEALRRARKAIEDDPATADPYFHAGLRLLGRPDVALRPEKHPAAGGRRVLLWTLALLGALLALLYWTRSQRARR